MGGGAGDQPVVQAVPLRQVHITLGVEVALGELKELGRGSAAALALADVRQSLTVPGPQAVERHAVHVGPAQEQRAIRVLREHRGLALEHRIVQRIALERALYRLGVVMPREVVVSDHIGASVRQQARPVPGASTHLDERRERRHGLHGGLGGNSEAVLVAQTTSRVGLRNNPLCKRPSALFPAIREVSEVRQ